MTPVTHPLLGDTLYTVKHPSGLEIIVWPREKAKGVYGVFATRYGSVYNTLPTADGGIRYTMLGDAQWVTEPGIRPEQILACATAFIRKGKRYECADKAYQRNRLWWHRLLPLRPKIIYLDRFPGRVKGRLHRMWNDLRNEWKRK